MNISVIIPYFNESSTIIQTLNELKDQSLKPKEVILVDSGSNDSTSQIINQWIVDNNLKEKYKNIYSGKMSPSSSINLGLNNIKSEIIAYIDCGLAIPSDWLKKNLSLMIENSSDIVSMRIHTVGTNIIDKSFIAQTYGYMQSTICLPGSLIKRSVFEKIGKFLENVRSGYDVDFVNRINSNNIKRTINYDLQSLSYRDINYTDNLIHGFKKVFSYSLAGWKTVGDKKPIFYFSFIFLLFLSFLYGTTYLFLYLYLIVRGYIVPYIKSHKNYLFTIPSFIIFLPISCLVIDVARISGYLFSLFRTNQRDPGLKS